MALLLDSAVFDEARAAADLGFVLGLTTNPKLLLAAGHSDHYAALAELCRLLPGTVYYQLEAHALPEMEAEFRRFRESGPNFGLKIACNLTGLQFAAVVSEQIPVCITGVFTPSQAYLAAQAGAQLVAIYVNRVTRLVGDGPGVVSDLVSALRGTTCEVLAAGIKSPAEAMDAIRAGAQNLTLPMSVITDMAVSLLTEQAIQEFDAALGG